MDDRVRLELSEQEARHLLKLIGEELERTEEVWVPYWLKIMSSLQAALNRAGYSSEPYQEKGK